MTEVMLSKEEAMKKYSGKGLYLMTVNIYYDGIKVAFLSDEDFLWGIFKKKDIVAQWAKQKIAARAASIGNTIDDEILWGDAGKTWGGNVIPEKTMWTFVDKGNGKDCRYEVDIKRI